MRSRYIREQKHICGPEYMEVDLLHVTPAEHRAGRRAKKEKASSIVQAQSNERNSRRYLCQLVATNFCGVRTILLHLTYKQEFLPDSWERAEKDLTNFLRRVAYRCKRAGKPRPQYIAVTEHQDADAETRAREVRYHHHIIMSCDLPAEEVKACWCTGTGKHREMLGLCRSDTAQFDHGEINGFCEYITKYPKRKRRWRQSQGLRKPERPAPNDTRYSERELHKAATLCVDDRGYWEGRYGRQYIRGRWRQYDFVGAEARYSEMGGWHIIAKFWADPRRQPTNKKARQRRQPRGLTLTICRPSTSGRPSNS